MGKRACTYFSALRSEVIDLTPSGLDINPSHYDPDTCPEQIRVRHYYSHWENDDNAQEKDLNKFARINVYIDVFQAEKTGAEFYYNTGSNARICLHTVPSFCILNGHDIIDDCHFFHNNLSFARCIRRTRP